MINKSNYKIGDIFFHPEKQILVEVSEVTIPKTKYKALNVNEEELYNLKILNPNTNERKPWKRYYASKINQVLVKLENMQAAKVLFGDKNE